MKENKVVAVGYRLTRDLVSKIEKFREVKSQELGLKLSKNQAVEMLLNDALNSNDIKWVEKNTK